MGPAPLEPYAHSGWMVNFLFSPGPKTWVYEVSVGLTCNSYIGVLTHVKEPLVPSFDHLALADGEGQRLATVVRGVELAAIALEGAAVVHVDLVAGFGLARAGGGRDDFRLQVLGVVSRLDEVRLPVARTSLLTMSPATAAAASARSRAIFMAEFRV